ncbi:gamma carbonic anhydrase family protein [Phaeovibrio sulfidiphilus]|uniref:Gamma carbonic anhydrase family protein n=2 Tax=Phaeovibrio sulfidiphilus TaxID=1220600 RepID=A0A8J6YP76_9PROT|nr:gamma carbonic anhydrase family protein [Phaeovibrio sulfidiphilus]
MARRFPGAHILPFNGIWPKIAEGVFIAPGAVVAGDVEIGPGSSVWFGCVLRGDVNVIRVGARSNIQDGTVVHVTAGGWGTTIGDDVTIGHRAVLHACTLENASFVGMGAVVLDQVVVEEKAMLAAGALASPGKRITAGTLWAGCPASEKRPLRPAEMDGFLDSARNYAALAANYLDAAARG